MSDLRAKPVGVPFRPLRPVNKKVTAGVLAFVALFMALPGGVFLWMGLTPGETVSERVLFISVAVILLALPGLLVWMMASRKLRTGNWWPSEEERFALRRKWAGHDRSSGLAPVMNWFDPLMVGLWVLLLGNAVWDLFHGRSYGWFDVLYPLLCAVNVFLFVRNALQGRKRKTV